MSHLLVQADAALPDSLARSLGRQACVDRLCDSRYQSFVIEREGALVAYLSLKDGDYLYHLFTALDCHRQGLARALWRYVLRRFGEAEYRLRSSLFAVQFYQQLGFEIEGAPAEFEGYQYQAMRWRS